MRLQELGYGAQAVTVADQIFDKFGIRLKVGTDFNAYHKLMLEHRPHQPLGAPFDPTIHKITPRNAYWITGEDVDGKIIHTQAMRLIDLKDKSLAEYLRGNFRQFPPVGVNLDLDASRYRAGPGARRITGRVSYDGEFWIDNSTDQYRGSGFSTAVNRFAFMTCLERFDPDYAFGFIAKPVAYKGFMERLGFLHNEPMAVNWKMADNEKVLEGFMVYSSNEDMRFLLGLPLPELAHAA